jgi:hypothetical protein
MKLKVFLYTCLFSLLVFIRDCGLQGVEASPVSEQVDNLRIEYPKQTSFVQVGSPSAEKLSNTEKEFGEVHITGEIYESEDDVNITLSVVHLNGSLLYSLYSMTTWHRQSGEVSFLSGSVGSDRWSMEWEIPRLATASIEIHVVVYTEVSRNICLLNTLKQ